MSSSIKFFPKYIKSTKISVDTKYTDVYNNKAVALESAAEH